ncbi:MAG: sugar transferase [Candidatus Woesearchaeota archaeon]
MINESFSRFIIVNSLLINSLLNIIFSSFFIKIKYNGESLEVKGRSNKLIILKVVNYLLFMTLCYYNCDKRNLILFDNLLMPIFVLAFYLLINNMEHKFVIGSNIKNFWFFQWDHIKSNILFTSSLITILLLFYDRKELVLSNFIINVSLLGLTDFFFISIIYFNKVSEKKFDIIKNKIFKANTYNEKEGNGFLGKGKYSINDNFSYYLPQSLSDVYLKNYKSLFQFIDENINLNNFDIRKSVIIRSSDTYNIEVIPNNSLEFYTNLHELNDFRRLNEYFLKVNNALVNGGVFIGNFEPASLRILKFKSKYPKYLSSLFYFFDFIWKRIFPKIPFLKYFYFEVTKGRNRVFNTSEVLGRLQYCGFKIHSFEQIDEKIFFIVIKNGNKISHQQPTYGPLIKLKRVGKNGEEIWVYKFRTMSPYSEFLQEYIFENFKLKKGGKFDNDFRITSWGKILRKLWLDELPMLINFFRGELKLVGVRPISFHYFNLYPEEFRKRRIKYKPGLVPPFYYDLPKTLEEIIESEKRYLDSYDKNPILTDVKYFLGSIKNIIFKKARSS